MKSKNILLCRNIKIPVQFKSALEHDEDALNFARKLYNNKLCSKFGSADFYIYKKSVDARNKDKIILIYTIALSADSFQKIKCSKDLPDKNFELTTVSEPKIPQIEKKCNVVVAGFGPSGMFCAYALALAGLNPIVIERGSDIDKRTEKVNKYWTTGELDTSTNVQFGEGGAGTFSDGKLLTRIGDPLSSYVLKTLNRFGAPDEILYLAKPHIGTDLLKRIVKNIRNEIIKLGGSVRFDSCLTGVDRNSCGNISSVTVNGMYDLPCDALFLCVGHSARDTFSLLMSNNFTLTPKPFSVGVRVEHLQSKITDSLYGKFAENPALEKAQYTLSAKKSSRGVYSFCMCPGGIVVASASDKNEIVTNGMSYFKRDGVNANSAIAVSVNPNDYGNTVDGAINFQREIENRAYKAGGNDSTAPIQLLGDFLNDNDKLNEPYDVFPTYTGKTRIYSLKKLFPEFITDMLRFGFNEFEKHISGFSYSGAVLTAPETRTSSPVRIDRNDARISVSCDNLYPCGEGAGYAGGITSAAVDGLKSALLFISRLADI